SVPTQLYTLSLHDALPIFGRKLVELLPPLLGEILDDLLPATVARLLGLVDTPVDPGALLLGDIPELLGDVVVDATEVPPLELLRLEEHTSELQSRENLVCR